MPSIPEMLNARFLLRTVCWTYKTSGHSPEKSELCLTHLMQKWERNGYGQSMLMEFLGKHAHQLTSGQRQYWGARGTATRICGL